MSSRILGLKVLVGNFSGGTCGETETESERSRAKELF